MRSPRNKTLDMDPERGAEYLRRCLRADDVRRGFSPCCTVCGDCLEIMPLLPRGFADLVIADPPYNMDKDFSSMSFRAMTQAEYFDYTVRWLEQARPLLCDTGSIYVCCDWRCSGAVQAALERFFTVRSRITWQREKGRGARRNWKNASEDIWFATVSDSYTFNLDAVRQRRRVIAPYRSGGEPKDWTETPDGKYRDTCPSNFWDDITVPYWSMAENTPHPTQKPEKLLAKLILASSNPGDMVFDPFLGSGSTSVTARKLGRLWCGVELSEQYCAWAEKRIEDAGRDNTIQGFSDGVFWERNSARPNKKEKK